MLQDIVTKIEKSCRDSAFSGGRVELMAVSKGQPVEKIETLLRAGHKTFAENKVQEVAAKWPELRARFPGIRLHLIGALQTNKAKEAVSLFDAIETVDREKLALELDKEMQRQQRFPECLVQVNIGREPQKSGVAPEALGDFLAFCREKTSLPICGLMCVPPADAPPAPYFALLRELAQRHGLKKLSMGMSADFETAIRFGATEVRVGTALFGERKAA